MRGVETKKSQLRRRVFEEVARLAYEGGGPEKLDELPFKINPGEIATYRESIFLERAIVGERLRVAMGLSTRPLTEHSPISDGVDESMIGEKYYEPPLVDIIRFACHSCPEKRLFVTDGCQLLDSLYEVCPRMLFDEENRSLSIRPTCISAQVRTLPYNAIIRRKDLCEGLRSRRSESMSTAEQN